MDEQRVDRPRRAVRATTAAPARPRHTSARCARRCRCCGADSDRRRCRRRTIRNSTGASSATPDQAERPRIAGALVEQPADGDVDHLPAGDRGEAPDRKRSNEGMTEGGVGVVTIGKLSYCTERRRAHRHSDLGQRRRHPSVPGARPRAGDARPRRRAALHRDRRAALRGGRRSRSASPRARSPRRSCPIASALFEIGLEAINARNQLQQGLIIGKRLLEPVIEPMYEAGLELARRSDLLIHHFILHPARAAADTAGTPQITVTFAHMLTPSRHIHPSGTAAARANGATRSAGRSRGSRSTRRC